MNALARLLTLVAAIAGPASTSHAQDSSPLPPPAAQPGDAPAYASAFGVSIDQAQQRLAAQAALVATTTMLRRTYHDRLAGIAIVHTPRFYLSVLLTGDAPVADGVVQAGPLSVPIRFTTGATATLDQLRAALANSQADLRAALAIPPGMGIDQRTGELVVIVAKTDLIPEGGAALTLRLHDIAGVPLRLRSIDVPGIDLADPVAAEGGARLVGTNPGDGKRYVCTAGFVVTDGTRTGIATAAHCPDDIGFVDADRREWPLTFVGQWGWGYQDVQINTSATPLPPLFFADTARTVSRSVEGQRALADTIAGDFVCHRGERTGYSCATVELTDFAPAGDLCGGACTPSWITVSGPHCGGGDSGAPVFAGTTAFGIVKGGSYRSDGSCAFYFYMSTDYLPVGWRLLTGDVRATVPVPAMPSPEPAPFGPSRDTAPQTGASGGGQVIAVGK